MLTAFICSNLLAVITAFSRSYRTDPLQMRNDETCSLFADEKLIINCESEYLIINLNSLLIERDQYRNNMGAFSLVNSVVTNGFERYNLALYNN